jgi:hypothetical protein
VELLDLESQPASLDVVELPDLESQPASLDIVERLASLIMGRLRRLRGWLLQGKVAIDLRCEHVAPGTPVVQEISELRPWTMTWSNCPDYMAPSRFHQLARECSRHGETVHFAHSMNWVAEVVGSCIMDYGQEKRGSIIEATHEMMSMQRALAPSALIEAIPYENTLNTTAFYLGMRFSKDWIAHFFCKEVAGNVQIGNVAMMLPYNALAQAATNLSMTWTYDEDIQMEPMKAS